MKHIDLFSGIGGFALAVDTVWPNSEHVFCDNDPFCQQVLKKHWPNSKIYGDIRTLTNTEQQRPISSKLEERPRLEEGLSAWNYRCDILTGGFPCQPFSQAGRRKGTDDNRYLWPEMFRVIREFKPTWVIAENVRGLVTWNEGMVLEQVCLDLESEGYEVQPLIIPAVAVNAPHRRDRVWFIAHSKHNADNLVGQNRNSENGKWLNKKKESKWDNEQSGTTTSSSWNQNWTEVATELCGVDDEFSSRLDEFGGYTKAAHRRERLKALGNAIVPQVAIEIMRAIKNQ